MDIVGAIASVFAKLFGLIANIFGTITGAFLGLSVLIFNWVASDSFISLSYTQLDNPFIEVGWTLTRDLTNIFFVIALIVIGLGTALRITGYQAQKALPLLVIIALLINFTPVILGLIVDASNIAMNFFLQGGYAGSTSFANYATSQWSNLSAFFDLDDFWNPTKNIAAAAGSIVLIGFNLMAAIVYGSFALLFILRYIAIWTLVILSPFAFASYILPATRQVWSMWWKQFIQWSIIGVIAAFFLYLGDHLIRIASASGFLEGSISEISNAPGLAPIINGILPYFIAIAFLFIGLFASITFSPQGASAIIKGGQRAAQTGGKVAGGWYLRSIRGVAGAPGRAVKTYSAARRMGKSRMGSLGTAVAPRPGRTWRRWKPPLPKEEGVSTFIRAKRMGFSTGDAFREATRHWGEWTPAGPRTRAAKSGLQKAAGRIWRSAVKPPKKAEDKKT